jgi:hypothetical protein
MHGNGLWYGVVREFEAISYQFTPTFFTSHKRPKTSETRMHYTMCVAMVNVQSVNYFVSFFAFKTVASCVAVSLSLAP